MTITIEYDMMNAWSHLTALEWITKLRNDGFTYDPQNKRKVDKETLIVTVVMVAPEEEKAGNR